MPTTFYNFKPTQNAPPFQFQPTLDGNDYVANVVWNTFGQRWYVSLLTSNAVPVFHQALVGSPQLVDVQSIRWENGWAIITAIFPTSFRVGDSFMMTVSEFLPVEYNTPHVQALIKSPTEIMYPLPEPARPATKLGRSTYDINLAGGYFITSRMVFRQATQQFEVWAPP